MPTCRRCETSNPHLAQAPAAQGNPTVSLPHCLIKHPPSLAEINVNPCFGIEILRRQLQVQMNRHISRRATDEHFELLAARCPFLPR
jgi:hypothetical protein